MSLSSFDIDPSRRDRERATALTPCAGNCGAMIRKTGTRLRCTPCSDKHAHQRKLERDRLRKRNGKAPKPPLS